ncbi:MAG: sterol desaturase family protein [Alphaproteobacteria bacterium]|nr:sterol desaturase family protein [Alphaproteobacteria bacterium]
MQSLGAHGLIAVLPVSKGLVVALWLALLFAAERLHPAAMPAAEALPAWRRLGRNGGLWLVNVALSPLLVLPLSAAAAAHGLAWRPSWWGGAPGLVLDLLLLDLLIYWWHRANHRLPFLWRFHEIHHRDRFLDTTTALRFHFGEVLLSAAARAVAIVLLGFPLASILVFETVVLIGTIFHHSNLALPAAFEAALSRLVVTPSIHWVHHHRLRADTDSNYATLLSLWDPLFGSRSPHPRTPAMAIGAPGREELRLAKLLRLPFAHWP